MDDNIIGTMGFDSTMITTTEESNQGFSKKLSSGTTNGISLTLAIRIENNISVIY